MDFYYSTDPNSAGKSPAEFNGQAATKVVGYMKRLNDETAEVLAGTHKWARCDKYADGAKRVIRGEEGFVMRETATYIRLSPVRVAKDKFSATIELRDGDGETVTVTVDPSGISGLDMSMETQKRGTAVLIKIPVRVTGSFFEGARELEAAEWMDKDLEFQEVDSWFQIRERPEWKRAVDSGPDFIDEAFEAVKEIVLTHCRGALRSARRGPEIM